MRVFAVQPQGSLRVQRKQQPAKDSGNLRANESSFRAFPIQFLYSFASILILLSYV